LTVAGLLLVLFATPALAFHELGVATCDGCHTVHNSQDGAPMSPDSPFGSGSLLRFSSATDVCLECHAAANGAVMGDDPLNPPKERGGGNFVFLLEDNINDRVVGNPPPIGGNHAGHNVTSVAWGISVDHDHNVSPGGSFPSAQLSCTSCHDPHGNENFRMLRGQGPTNLTSFAFVNPAPEATGLNLLMGQETQTNHTAYLQGWAAWCANCHGYYHEQNNQGFDHPAEHELEQEIADSYNQYNGPDDPTGGSFTTAYVPDVPVEDPAMTTSTTSGATANSRVTCITCHRAHATSAPASTRWDPKVEFLDTDGMASASYPLPNPYADPSQRALCVKCHYAEAADHGFGHPCMQCHGQSGN
jgi:predicted CXXCH cytochrome family protein